MNTLKLSIQKIKRIISKIKLKMMKNVKILNQSYQFINYYHQIKNK